MVEYAKEHEEDLFKKYQAQITKSQILEFNVSGKQVRMDSKLIGSNIAWYTRYELIHETLRLFIAEREEFIYKKSLSKEEFLLIRSIEGETGNKVVYRSTKVEIDQQFIALGLLMYRFINLFKSNLYGQYQTLKTVFEQKFSVSKEKLVLPLENEKYTDGAYNSVGNQDYCQDNFIDLLLTGMQGSKPRYEVSLDSQDQNRLIVIDNITGNQIESQHVIARKDPTQKKWRIKTDEGKYRYFNLETLRASILRKKLKEIPIEETNIRCNVEATIFQLGYHYSNDKSNYRALAKHKLWAYSRSLWINFVRILKYVTQICQRALASLQKTIYTINMCDLLLYNAFVLSIEIITNKYPKYMQFSTF